MDQVATTSFDYQSENNNYLALPIEVILKIISNITSTDDIRNCMLLSHEINNSMITSPDIAKNIRINLDDYSKEVINYLCKNGKYIRNLSMVGNVGLSKTLRDVLAKVPNLEHLDIRSFILASISSTKDEDSADMKKLKTLKICVSDLENFRNVTKNVQNIEKLTMTTYAYDQTDLKIIYDFICCQNNLKELNVTTFNNNINPLPLEDSTRKVNFKLKKFKFVTFLNWIDENENFSNFIALHADTLEELEVNHSLTPESIQVILKKCKKLQKLSLKCDIFSQNYPRLSQDTILPNLKHFEDQQPRGLDLYPILYRFPNIESLSCKVVSAVGRKFEKLKRLEVDTFNAFCYFREEIMRNTLTYFENVEHLIIKNSKGGHYEEITEHLYILKNLKTFSYRADSYTNISIWTDDNEVVPAGYRFHKIIADLEKGTLKVSNYIVQHDKELFDILIEIYEGFEFYEFCFDVEKIQKIEF